MLKIGIARSKTKMNLKPRLSSRRLRCERHSGFALIATVIVMSLLLVVCLGMLSLSEISLRSEAGDRHVDRAQSNARLALMLAIAELQKTAGPDARVTASAEAVAGSDGPRQLTGVWRSWEGKDHAAGTGLPVKPDYGSKLLSVDPSNPDGAGRFIGWLVSDAGVATGAKSPPDLQKGSATTPLLAEGSLGSESGMEVHIEPEQIGEKGKIAWWIQGQNSKALVIEPEPEPADAEGWSQRLASYGRADLVGFGLKSPDDIEKAFSLKALDLISDVTLPESGKRVAEEYFHDMTAYSCGLLTNTANGGWRRDLSVFSEFAHPSMGLIPNSGMAVFSKTPGVEHLASLRIGDGNANGSIYPWATSGTHSMSWSGLADFATLYKKLNRTSTGEPYFDDYDPTAPGGNLDYADEIMISSVLARNHWIFSFFATPKGNFYRPCLIYKNAMTFWNPYSVAIRTTNTSPFYHNNQGITYPPFDFDITVGSTTKSIPLRKMFVNDDNSLTKVTVNFGQSDDRIWKPGESRIYSNSPGYRQLNLSSPNIAVDPGYQPDGGSFRFWEDNTTRIHGDTLMSAKIRATPRVNPFFFKLNSSITGGTRNTKGQEFALPVATFAEKIPVPVLNNSKKLKDISGAGNEFPFATVVFGLRDLLDANIRTKGYINTKPVISYSATRGDDSLEDSSYDLRIYDTASFNAPEIPSSDDDLSFGNDHSGYVGTSFTAQSGIPRWIVTELPTRPLLSLGELQHFDIGFNNPLPPRVSQPIGNSDATPKMQPDEMKHPDKAAYDHSYAANHLLFDDWFFSSISPDGASKGMEQTYREHLTGDTHLRNAAYRPAAILSKKDAAKAASALMSDKDAWRNIAAGLEVEGMFNVNSTSVSAWAALLKNQRNAQVPKVTIDPTHQGAWDTVTVAGKPHPVARTSVTSDPSITRPQISLLIEPCEMSDDQMDALAEEIVEQIKKRGPFLSLSEFINRQLSNDDDLALAGAVESALVKLAESSDANRNPFLKLQTAFPQQASQFGDHNEIYTYPKAAEGYAIHGTPGWPRQADLLRSLAPILSARDDTFLIRAYGSSVDSETGRVKAQAWCEAVVQRNASYVDSTTDADTAYPPTSPANQIFGRKFEIVSFRWLSPEEI